MHLSDTHIAQEPFRCLVIGVGGCGCAVINKMIAVKYAGPTYVAVDSASQALKGCKAAQKIHIPETLLHDAPSAHELAEFLTGIPNADMVFIVSGMGGATGTRISPIIAEYVKQHGALTIGVAALPLSNEGNERNATAEKGLADFCSHSDSLLVVALEDLCASMIPPHYTEDIYPRADKAIATGIMAITDTVIRQGLVGVDFADLKAALGNGGIFRIGYGAATGRHRVLQAAERAVSCPTLGADALKAASNAIIIITGDNAVSLDAVSEAVDIVTGSCAENTKITLQAFQDDREGVFSVVIVTS